MAAAAAQAPAAHAGSGAEADARSKTKTEAHRRGRAAVPAVPAVPAAPAGVPARLRIRALPDVSGQPAGWFASGALGSGEQSYWDGSRWTARRCWRNEMWIDQPLEPSLQPAR